jgi:hypothetical protein
VKSILESLVQQARQQDLPFLIVGGNALILLGVPHKVLTEHATSRIIPTSCN